MDGDDKEQEIPLVDEPATPAIVGSIVLGGGVLPEHVVEIEATKMKSAENVAAIRKEIEYRGPSVIIAKRECLEAIRARKKKEKKA